MTSIDVKVLNIPDNTTTFVLAYAAFILVTAVVDSATWVIATIVMRFGQDHTLGALLGKARA
jgi:hypothetical protein